MKGLGISALVVLVAGGATAFEAHAPLAVLQPTLRDQLLPGTIHNIRWMPSAGIDSVDLVLRSGNSNNLDTVLPIADSQPNIGVYEWVVPDITLSDYSIMIRDSQHPEVSNYSPFFSISSQSVIKNVADRESQISEPESQINEIEMVPITTLSTPTSASDSDASTQADIKSVKSAEATSSSAASVEVPGSTVASQPLPKSTASVRPTNTISIRILEKTTVVAYGHHSHSSGSSAEPTMAALSMAANGTATDVALIETASVSSTTSQGVWASAVPSGSGNHPFMVQIANSATRAGISMFGAGLALVVYYGFVI